MLPYEGEDAGTAGVRSRHSVAAGAGRLYADVSAQVEVIIIGADPITRFPLLNAVLSTHVQSMILYAEVRTGDCGGAVVIAEAILAQDKTTRTVHLGTAEQSLFISIVHTGDMCDFIKYEGEDAGTACNRSRHSVAAGAGRLCTDVSAQVEVIIMRADSITGFPDSYAVLSAPVEAKLGFAEVRTGNGGDAVVIAETILVKDREANTVHLGGAY